MIKNTVSIWLLVNDFDVAIDFYVKRLNLFEVESDRNEGIHRQVSLRLKELCVNFVLDLSCVPDSDARASLVGHQWGDKLAFNLPVVDLEILEDYFQRSGVKITGRTELPYAEWIFVKDPFGNELSLCQSFE